MKRYLLAFLLLHLLLPDRAAAHFERSNLGARADAMGGAFVSIADDATALFRNSAGMVYIESPLIYGDYAKPFGLEELDESAAAAILPVYGMTFGAGLYHLSLDEAVSENLFVAGAGRKLLEGTQGTFVSVGTAVRIGRVSYGGFCPCTTVPGDRTEVTGDLGLLVRPLPVVSFAYSIENIREVDFGIAAGSVSWGRIHRWGVAYFWEKKVAISFEQEHVSNDVLRHYGFAVRAAAPFELMAGFYEGNVSGGVRYVSERLRVIIAFVSNGELGVTPRASIEISPWLQGGDRSE